jgi:alpha-ribazole phosphatase
VVTGAFIWRHPQPHGAHGRCIGITDLPIDRRRAKRLAHRMRHAVRREGGPREVMTSPLQRCADVGRWLRRWGFQHRIDPRLSELDFGAWDGQPWANIGASAVDAWCADFATHTPGQGESVEALMARCRDWLGEKGDHEVCVVAHAGWINAMRWVVTGKAAPYLAADWPAAVGYGVRVE